jgi:hypothetical protein
VGYCQSGEAAQPLRELRRCRVGNGRPPVMTDEVSTVGFQAIEERGDIRGRGLEAVIPVGWSGGGLTAADLHGDGPIAGLRERWQLMSPGARIVGNAMQQQDQRSRTEGQATEMQWAV